MSQHETFPPRGVRRLAAALAFAAAVVVAAPLAPPAQAADDGSAQVSCQLPPQIRRLGRQATYLAAGRIIQTTASDCRVRGGQAKPLPAASAAATPAPAAAGGAMAVMVGGDAQQAACPVSGEIVGLQAASSLSVRAGPGTAHPRQDRLANGRRVFVCDGTADEKWLGVVYPTAAGQDCGVADPRAEAAPYAGPCRHGWVSAGWVRTHAAGADAH